MNKVGAKVSIIVPIYNVEKYLKCCLDSILAQTFQDWEAVLVDDGSRDGSGVICDEYAAKDSRFRVIHKENGGVSSARNIGLDNIQGDWIVFVDGDDWISPNMLDRLIKKAKETDSEIVLGDIEFVYSDRKKKYRVSKWKSEKRESLNSYIVSVWTSLCGGIVQKSLYQTYALRSPLKVSYCEDFHLMVRLCYYAKKVVNVHYPFYYYRQQEGSVMHNLNKKTEQDEQWVYQDIIRFFKEQGVYDDYQKSMCWRMLKATQELVLERETWNAFREMVPEKKHYIWDCPYINNKLKLNMWCLTHHLSWISGLLLILRRLRHA